jgi:hypothetical protein
MRQTAEQLRTEFSAIINSYAIKMWDLLKQTQDRDKEMGFMKRREIDARYIASIASGEDGKPLHSNESKREKAAQDILDFDKDYQSSKNRLDLINLVIAELTSGLEILKFKKSCMTAQAELLTALMQPVMVPVMHEDYKGATQEED